MVNSNRFNFIKNKAWETRKRLKIRISYINAEEVLRNNYKDKCIIRYMDFGASADADIVSFLHEKLDITVIIINSRRNTPLLKKRLNFSLAHEIGHIELGHFEQLKDKSINKAALEEEADEFASHFLVPLSRLHNCKRSTNQQLSDIFLVSEEVIAIQKSKIGIISSRRKSKYRYSY